MKWVKQVMALILCILVVSSNPLSVLAETMDDNNVDVIESEEAVCEDCNAFLDELGNVIHEETCLTLCTCEKIGETHQEDCRFYVAPEKTLYEKMMECTEFSLLYAFFLESINDENCAENIMTFTSEQIFSLLDHMEELFAKIEDPDEQDLYDREDLLLSFSLLPNYQERCNECHEFPCICSVEEECTCEVKQEDIHEKTCALFYEWIYINLMQASSVDTFSEYSSMLNEYETTAFRCWLDENDLLSSFNVHMENILSNGVGVYLVKNSSKSANVENALKLSKAAVFNSETGMYDITLESYTTGVIEEGKVLPADTVLVLDTSGSMAYDYYTNRIGTPMYGDYFKHPSGNYWGWYENTHLVNGENPYVLLPDGTFARAAYSTTDANNVEIFRVLDDGPYKNQYFYPCMLAESIVNVPRVNTSYPVYTLYSAIDIERVKVQTGVPMFGTKFTYNSITYYGWLQDSHGNPYVRLEDGNFISAEYSRTDSKGVEIFKYTDEDTGKVFEFYPRLQEKDNNVTRAENLPIVQLYSGYNTQRMSALHDAVAEFLRMTAERNSDASADGQSRVAIVQFSCDVHGGTAPTKVVRGLSVITKDNVDEWIALTYGITDGGSSTHTEIGDGMVLAEEIIAKSSRDSFKAVIAFTDGKPECDETSGGGFSFIQTQKAINAAKEINDKYNGVVYTVCIQDHAAVNAGQTLPPREGKGVNDDKNNVNRFMHLLSSNYPNAVDMDTTGTGSTDGGYYMVPGSDGDLVSIFTQIGDQIGEATIDLDANAKVMDYMTPYYSIPAGANVDISVMDASYSGGTLSWSASDMDLSHITYVVDAEKALVQVTGFDYNHNFVASQGRVEGNIAEEGDFYGRKLVIRFSISVSKDFLGGDNVVTNEKKSGVYTDAGLVGEFEIPTVDVPISYIQPIWTTKDIYLSQQASLPEVIKLGEYTQNGETWKINGINNAYVDIQYIVTDPNGNSITYTIPAGTAYENLVDQYWSEGAVTHPLLKEDTTYTVTCNVSSVTDESNYKTKSVSAQVKVYKPEITFQDSAIELSDIPVFDDENFVGVVWKNGDEEANVTLMGAAPELDFVYTPSEAAFTEDTAVKVDVVAKGDGSKVPVDQDITQYVTFYRDSCSYDDCDHKESVKVSATDSNRVNFVVHLKSFDLLITKSGTQEIDENQTYVFRITDENGFAMDVTIVGNGSVIVKNLPAGVYTVAELTTWSWRYTPKSNNQQASAADAQNGVTTVTFENERKNSFWLSGDSWIENWWKQDGNTWVVVPRNEQNNVIQ